MNSGFYVMFHSALIVQISMHGLGLKTHAHKRVDGDFFQREKNIFTLRLSGGSLRKRLVHYCQLQLNNEIQVSLTCVFLERCGAVCC